MNKLKVVSRESFNGKRFGRWTVINDGPDKEKTWGGSIKRHRVLVVKCDCGTVRSVIAAHLINGKSNSCGCYRKEWAAKLVQKRLNHGKQTAAYR